MKLLNNSENTPEEHTLPDITVEQKAPQKDNQQELIQKLLQDKKSQEKTTTKLSSLNSGKWRSMSAHEVASMRNKIFSLVFLALSVVLWTSFVGPSLNERESLQNKLDTATTATNKYIAEKKQAEKITQFADAVVSHTPAITTCVNSNRECESAISPLRKHIDNQQRAQKIAQYYLQIGDLTDPKLLVDERSLLTNIDLFLLRYGPQNRIQKRSMGDITSITIGDPKNEKGDIYSVPVELVINFPNDTSLITFLKNTENRIIQNEVIALPPILYKVEQVEYDIAEYKSEQETTVKLIAYYYSNSSE